MKKFVVLGAGESGKGTALLAKKQGYSVFVSDSGPIDSQIKQLFEKHQIEWEENQHSLNRILGANLIMKSPGIPERVEVMREIRKAGIQVQSEIEFASQYTSAKIIGITGSNGKTTTTLLIHHLLKESGLNVGLAGNIGKSFAQLVAEEEYQLFVLEISSFQLDDIHSFAPEIGVITNITPDHLDRYNDDFSTYIASKMRITSFQKKNQFLLFNSDDPVLDNAIKESQTNAQKIPFGFDQNKIPGVHYSDKKIHIHTNKSNDMISTSQFSLQGRHNLLNAMAAVSVARLLDVSKDSIRESLFSFTSIPHRLEKVLKIQHITYINDSKATNVNATFYALESMEGQTVWIVGGVDKGNDYDCLLPLVREKVKAIVCLGLDNEKLIESFSPVVDLMVETTSMKEAVSIARDLADKKDTVLLSPACSSFDLFDNYEDRGNQFKEAVKNL